MLEVKLIQATITDIPRIRALAEIIWRQYYPAIISSSQINYMLQLMYSEESMKSQLIEKKHSFYFVNEGEQEVGFLSLEELPNGVWQLHKFYVNQQLARRGIGQKSFLQILELTKASEIILTVNRQNFKAINFYFKCGFVIDHVADFEIGNDYVMNDFVMKWFKKI